MKPIEEKYKEMFRRALERFFKNWGFEVPSYEDNEEGETVFCIGGRKCPAGFNSEGDVVLYLIDTFKNEHIEYTEGIIFSCNKDNPRKILKPKIAFIYKNPEIQFLYIEVTDKYKKGDVIFETHCICCGGTYIKTLEYLPFSSDIPEFQAYMEKHIGG